MTMGKAAVWTDSRYWTQAEREMDCNWDLKKEGRKPHEIVPNKHICKRTVTDRSLARGSEAGYAGDLGIPSCLSVGITVIVSWLLTEMSTGGRVGFDPFLVSFGMFFL